MTRLLVVAVLLVTTAAALLSVAESTTRTEAAPPPAKPQNSPPTEVDPTTPLPDGRRPLGGKGHHLLMVHSLTRHGSRAPDKVVATDICRPVFDGLGDERGGPPSFGPGEGKKKLAATNTEPWYAPGSLRATSARAASGTTLNKKPNIFKLFVAEFGTGPAELTDVGVTQMRDAGRFLMMRYEKRGFVFGDYASHPEDWAFNAREGARQQRSMMGLVQGLFPDEVVPITVRPREQDAILSGPPAQCADTARDYILEWHATKGKDLVHSRYEQVVRPFELLCNTSLRDNPANRETNGGNPHAYLGDISDLMDAMNRNQRGPLPISPQQHDQLTKLAFELEMGAHFDDPRGATIFAGDFPEFLLSSFEDKVKNPDQGPKFVLHTCSREVMYALEDLFGWNRFRLRGQPLGRVDAGSTFMFELYDDGSVQVLVWTPFNWAPPALLQPPMSLQEFRGVYDKYRAQRGTWRDICIHKNATTKGKAGAGSLRAAAVTSSSSSTTSKPPSAGASASMALAGQPDSSVALESDASALAVPLSEERAQVLAHVFAVAGLCALVSMVVVGWVRAKRAGYSHL